ncbi:hypothetical protein, partial [Rhodoblastus sp.]
QTRLDAMKAVAPKVMAFYNSLNDKQKQEFVRLRDHMMRFGWEERHGVAGWGPGLQMDDDLDEK